MSPHYFPVLLQSMCGLFYVFLNHQFVFPLISNLKRPTKKRVDKIFVYSHVEIYAIDVTIGLLGYVLLAQHIDTIPISSLVISNIPTWPLLVGKIFLVASLYFSLPLQIFAAREYLYEALDLERNDANLKRLNIGFIGSSFVLGLFFEGVTTYFGLIGGTVGVMMAGFIPLACYYKLITLTDADKFMMAFVAVVSAICFVGAVYSVISPA
jgi:amino acid permease